MLARRQGVLSLPLLLLAGLGRWPEALSLQGLLKEDDDSHVPASSLSLSVGVKRFDQPWIIDAEGDLSPLVRVGLAAPARIVVPLLFCHARHSNGSCRHDATHCPTL